MYPVSASYKSAVNAPERAWQVIIELQTAFETFELTGADIVEKSLKVKDGVVSGTAFSLGGIVAADLSVSLINADGRFDESQLNGGILRPYIGLEVAPDEFEWLPLGVFMIDDVAAAIRNPARPFRAVNLMAGDNMLRFDRPFKNVPITFPCSNLALLSAVCLHCGVTLATTSFLHSSYMIAARPDGDMTCRDIVSNIAEMACCWSRCNRQGQLELAWFKNPGAVQEAVLDGNTDSVDGGDFSWWNNKDYNGGTFVEETPDVILDPLNRYDFSVDDSPITITGVSLETDEQILLAGSDRYAIAITDNPLIQDNAQEVIQAIWERLVGFTFMPFNSNRRDDPAMQAGDLVEHINVNGQTYRTIITEYNYVFGGKCLMAAVGASEVATGYKSTMTKKVSQLRRKIAQKQVQIDAMDLAVRNAFSLLAGIKGGYRIDGDTLPDEKYHGKMFVASSLDLENENTEVYQYAGLGGMGYFPHGLSNPPSQAWTTDGAFLTGLVTANMVQTGMLKSLNGESWLDLDNGAFSFGNGALKWDKANGFDSLASRKLTTPGSLLYGTVGDIQRTGVEGSYTTPGLSLLLNLSAIMTIVGSHDFGGHVSFSKSNSDQDEFLRADSQGAHLVYVNEDFTGTTVSCGPDGISFEVNGHTHGLTQKVAITTPSGTRYLNYQNGQYIGLTTS